MMHNKVQDIGHYQYCSRANWSMSTGKNSPATKEEKITVSAAEMHGSFQSKLTATASPFIQRESQQSNMQSLGMLRKKGEEVMGIGHED